MCLARLLSSLHGDKTSDHFQEGRNARSITWAVRHERGRPVRIGAAASLHLEFHAVEFGHVEGDELAGDVAVVGVERT